MAHQTVDLQQPAKGKALVPRGPFPCIYSTYAVPEGGEIVACGRHPISHQTDDKMKLFDDVLVLRGGSDIQE